MFKSVLSGSKLFAKGTLGMVYLAQVSQAVVTFTFSLRRVLKASMASFLFLNLTGFFGAGFSSSDSELLETTTSHNVIKLFMLNPAEHEICPADKC